MRTVPAIAAFVPAAEPPPEASSATSGATLL